MESYFHNGLITSQFKSLMTSLEGLKKNKKTAFNLIKIMKPFFSFYQNFLAFWPQNFLAQSESFPVNLCASRNTLDCSCFYYFWGAENIYSMLK